MRVDARPDTPAELTDTINALIEAYEAGALHGIAVATIIGNAPDFAVITRSAGAQAMMTSIIGTLWLDQQLGMLRGIKLNKAMQAEPVKKPGGGLVGPNGEELN